MMLSIFCIGDCETEEVMPVLYNWGVMLFVLFSFIITSSLHCEIKNLTSKNSSNSFPKNLVFKHNYQVWDFLLPGYLLNNAKRNRESSKKSRTKIYKIISMREESEDPLLDLSDQKGLTVGFNLVEECAVLVTTEAVEQKT